MFTLFASCLPAEKPEETTVVEVEAAGVAPVDVGEPATEAAPPFDGAIAAPEVVPVAPGALQADWVWARPGAEGCELAVLHAPALEITSLASLPACPASVVLVPGAPRVLVTFDGSELPGMLLSYGTVAPEALPALPEVGPSGTDWSRHALALTREGGVVIEAEWGVHAGMECEGPCEARTGQGRWRLVGGAWTAESMPPGGWSAAPGAGASSGAVELRPEPEAPASSVVPTGARLDALARATGGQLAEATWYFHRDVDGSVPPLAWPSTPRGEAGDLPTGPVLVEVGDAWRPLPGTGSLPELRLFAQGSWVAAGDSRGTTLYDLRNLSASWRGDGVLWPWPPSMGRAPSGSRPTQAR